MNVWMPILLLLILVEVWWLGEQKRSAYGGKLNDLINFTTIRQN